MLKYNIKQSIRGMRKNIVFTFLNIFGFAIGFAAFMTLALYTYQEYTVDRDIPHSNRIYRLINAENKEALIDYDAIQNIKALYPEITLSVPISYSGLGNINPYLQIDGKENFIKIQEFISTNNDFFKLFPFKVISGNPKKPFQDVNSAIITESTARKLFGTTNPIGTTVNFGGFLKATITAVIEDLPKNMSINGDLLFNSENPEYRFSQSCDNGTCYNPFTNYLLLNPETDIKQFENKLNQTFPENKMRVKKVILQPITDIYLNNNIAAGNNKVGNKSMIKIFLSIALLTLLLSIINYVNFSISRQLSTLKDYGIKLTNGAEFSQLQKYYAVDVALLILFSVLISIFFTIASLPLASKLLNTFLDKTLFLRPDLLTIIVLSIITVWVIATIVPLLILSRFDIQMLFGKKTLKSGKQYWRNVLTISQFIISIVLISSLFIIQKQLHYVKSYDLGFNDERLLHINFGNNFANKEVFKNKLETLPFIENLSFSHGMSGGDAILYVGDEQSEKKDIYLRTIYIDQNFLKTFNIPLLQGKTMLDADLNKTCYMNETAIKEYEWDSYEGKVFTNGNYQVIGVVKDFTVSSLRDKMEPVCLIYNNSQISAINLKLKPGNLSEQMKIIQSKWRETAGFTPFEYGFYDEYFDSLYRKEEQQAQTIGWFSFIAFLITGIGLLGQVFQNTQTRIKEIGIRKINGAKIGEIIFLLNINLLKWVVLAFIIATPIAYYIMNKWLENFAYKTTLSWWIFVLSGLSALIIATITVSWQSWQAARKNPVEALRYE